MLFIAICLAHPPCRPLHPHPPTLPSMDAPLPGVAYDEPMLGLCYTVRVAVHNGRTFVGPAYDLVNVTQLDVPGWKVLQVRWGGRGEG